MGLNADSGLWWNLPGIRAAWQPVRAPGPLLARYNVAHGGNNRYQVTDGTSPGWSGARGWIFTGASSQYLKTNILTSTTHTIIVAFGNAANQQGGGLVGDAWQGLSPYYYNIRRYHGVPGEDMAEGSGTVTGVMAVSPSGGYYNGRSETSSYVMGTLGRMILIGCLGSNSAGAPETPYATADVRAVAIYDVTLSAVQVRDASRQMAYCDSNPAWNVWAPRRSWFLPALATAYTESLTLGRTHDATGAGGASASAAGNWGRTHAATTSAVAAALGSVALGDARGATAAGAAAAGAAHTLGRVATIAETGQAAASGAQTLGRIHAATNTGAAAALAAQTLRRTHATTAAGSAAASASVAAGARRGVVATAIGAALGAAAVAIRRALAAVGIEPPHGLVDLTLHARSVELTVDGRSVDLTLEDR